MKPSKRLFQSAKIIAVYNQKGGCGKTMVSMQLAGLLAWRGYKTLVIDMDKQQTASTWFAMGEARESPFPANVISLKIDTEHLLGAIRNFRDDYDFIFIDCPPAIDTSIPWSALNVASVGIIPIVPVLDNIWATNPAFLLGDEAKKLNPDLQLFYVLTNVRRGKLFDACKSKLMEIPHIAEGWIPQLGDSLSQRNAYPECQWFGTILHGLKPNRPVAAMKELDLLADDFLKVFNIKGRKK